MRRARGAGRAVRARLLRIVKRTALLVGAVVITLMAVRIWDTQRGPPLELWHTYRAGRAQRGGARRGRLEPVPRRRAGGLRRGAGRGHGRRSTPRTAFRSTATSRAARSIRGISRRTGTAPSCWSRKAPRSAPWCCCTGSPTRPTASVTSPGAMPTTASSRSCRGCRRTAPCRRRWPRSSGRTGWPRRGSPCARRARGSARRCRCTSWGSRTAARSP